MSKKCIWCGQAVNPGLAGNGYYCPCCDEDLTESDVNDMTVFETITASPEVLAAEFVAEFSIYGGRCYWFSLLLAEKGHSVFEQRFNTKSEAIAATVAKLKEVCVEQNSVDDTQPGLCSNDHTQKEVAE